MGVCFAANAHEDDRYQATSIDTLLHMISVGHGMTLVPELAARKPLGGITYQRFKNPQPNRNIILIGRTNSARGAGLERLADFISKNLDSPD